MDINKLLLDILSLAGGGIITIAAAYYLIRPDIQKYLKLKSAEVKMEDYPQLLMLRLQAHERLILFIDRINPSNLLIRLHQNGLSVTHMQSMLLNEIRSEYQHNVAQQLYVNPLIWNVISKLKEDTLAMVNNGVRNLPEDATGVDLSKRILQHIATVAENPYDLTLDLIKNDIQKLF